MTDYEFIIAYEEGDTEELPDDDAITAGFQQLIDNGIVWQLQGHYGRTAIRLLQEGKCHYPKK